MTIFTSMYLKKTALGITLLTSATIFAQEEEPIIQRVPQDSTVKTMNMDAVYDRPFLTVNKSPAAVGGYLEANSIYTNKDGITDGLSFQARRLTIFMSASLSKRIKFLTEIEFEDGTKEIGIEFAAMDVAFHPAFNFRGGIIMNPIGAFNQNHDGPKWEFVERPDVAVNLLPATWSNAGFGMYGKTYKGDWIFGYEAYLTNGLDSNIIDNEENKTFMPAAKENEERFEENFSGKPLVSGKIAIKNRRIGEVGFSYMGGAYNKFEEDGLVLDEKRRVAVFAIDFNTTIKKTGTYLVGEAVYALIAVPSSFTQQFGNKQQGAFIDVVQPILKRRILAWEDATLNIATRFDYVDWNVGKFEGTNLEIGDQILAVTPAISFRPTSQTVFRLNYKYSWQKDILSNSAAKSASWLLGFSTYF
ncbi:hypothetical protein JM83_1143 [Gillisia sp. Hel_I_86]|uniref:hypothetical protein n=1 Tax=Gillisia sp. Hel_I_86 TaxID=1249981 RepID=UPI00119C8589|nr:hypothetical protein [Gillisia sp. Hel_I_86]TVZ26189.1 hypothetical protein JM83_1143 [Gillisia sp. Hel_I_86]